MNEEEYETIRRVKARLNPKLRVAEAALAKRRAAIHKRFDKRQRVATAFFEPTKNQKRLLRLLGLTIPERYEWAAEMLHLAGYEVSANPFGKDSRHTQYMTDETFLQETTAETVHAAARAHHLETIKLYKERIAAGIPPHEA